MLEFRNVSFSYGEKEIFKDFSFSLKEGTSTAILGPSGYGKTTFLELASGFLKPQSGIVTPFCGKPTFVFQEDRLLPWYTALENLTAVNIGKEKALEYLEKVGLSDCADKYPDELSGGMCRRLSIARALAFGGDVYLFDEPLRGLDIKTSAEILELIKSETTGKTSLIITHNPKEAFLLSEKIIIAGKNPFVIIAERNKSDFSDEKIFTDFLESVI
ncbi:MAG: ABC transporter ATP-binding protein [Oscillospiraceae bacterium]|nr:ABC transporter ATP-binding protein [Oscillospiraceae bacterium]